MRVRNILLGYVLLHSAQALYLRDTSYTSLTARANSKEPSLTATANSKEPTLEWSQCNLDFGTKDQNEMQKEFDCARLQVPLDYTNSSDTRTIKLDLIRFKATKAPHKGSMFFNPGGPGASAVESMLGFGPILSDNVNGQYDIIGFDSRGTGRTIPFTCPEPTPSEDTTGLKPRDFNDLPQLYTWDFFKTVWWKEGDEFAERCWEANQDMGQFYGTTAVARDMMSVVDALGQGDKLNYWGVSYGTVLGQVVASMFPNRVGRIVLDGNMNADDYAATAWLDSITDVERSLANFFDECVKSGKKACALADFHGSKTTGESLLETFNEKLKVAFADTASKDESYEAYTLKQNVRPALYSALSNTIEAFFKGEKPNKTPKRSDTSQPSVPTKTWSSSMNYILPAIACGDSSYRINDPDDYFPLYQAQYEKSSFADVVVPDTIKCVKWRFSAVEPIDLNKLRQVNTSNPILLVNGRYDPATSLPSALKVAAKFPRSRLVVHEGVGHSSFAHLSSCTLNAVRKYFLYGKMPGVNTTCSPDMTAFEFGKLSG
ncbi:hypothetical protein FPOAC2_12935 [Fusarium poae]